MNIEYFITKSGTGDEIEMVNLINEDGSFIQMPKSTYDAQQAAIANFIFSSVEEAAPEEEVPPIEEETI